MLFFFGQPVFHRISLLVGWCGTARGLFHPEDPREMGLRLGGWPVKFLGHAHLRILGIQLLLKCLLETKRQVGRKSGSL